MIRMMMTTMIHVLMMMMTFDRSPLAHLRSIAREKITALSPGFNAAWWWPSLCLPSYMTCMNMMGIIIIILIMIGMMTYMKEIMIAVFQSSLMNDDDHHHLISLGSMKVKKSLLRTWSYLPPQAFLFQKFCEIIFKTIFQKLLKTFLFVHFSSSRSFMLHYFQHISQPSISSSTLAFHRHRIVINLCS